MPVTAQTTAQEFQQLLTNGTAGLAPANPPRIPPEKLIIRHRRILQVYRAKGYTPEQIATVLAQPDIGITINPVTLNRLLNAAPKRQRKKS